MNKLYLFLAMVGLVIFATIVGGFFYFNREVVSPVACSQEAKLCPDGSSVGRSGPNCEFAQCSTIIKTGDTGTIQGKVDIGPICPVERVDVPCPVPPEAYTSREVALYYSDGITLFKRMHFLSDGTYNFQVPAGIYILNTPGQGIGNNSKDLPKTVTITSGQTIEINFSIDTGIR